MGSHNDDVQKPESAAERRQREYRAQQEKANIQKRERFVERHGLRIESELRMVHGVDDPDIIKKTIELVAANYVVDNKVLDRFAHDELESFREKAEATTSASQPPNTAECEVYGAAPQSSPSTSNEFPRAAGEVLSQNRGHQTAPENSSASVSPPQSWTPNVAPAISTNPEADLQKSVQETRWEEQAATWERQRQLAGRYDFKNPPNRFNGPPPSPTSPTPHNSEPPRDPHTPQVAASAPPVSPLAQAMAQRAEASGSGLQLTANEILNRHGNSPLQVRYQQMQEQREQTERSASPVPSTAQSMAARGNTPSEKGHESPLMARFVTSTTKQKAAEEEQTRSNERGLTNGRGGRPR